MIINWYEYETVTALKEQNKYSVCYSCYILLAFRWFAYFSQLLYHLENITQTGNTSQNYKPLLPYSSVFPSCKLEQGTVIASGWSLLSAPV